MSKRVGRDEGHQVDILLGLAVIEVPHKTDRFREGDGVGEGLRGEFKDPRLAELVGVRSAH
jgi:hypothetical protein